MDKKLPSKYYIGVSSSHHDQAIALVDAEGNLVFAEATERYLQNKGSVGSTADNIFHVEKIFSRYHTSEYELAFGWITFESFPFLLFANSIAYFSRKFVGLIRRAGKLLNIHNNEYNSLFNYHLSYHLATRITAGASIRLLLNTKYQVAPKGTTAFDHHLCHTLYAYSSSSFSQATIVVLDGGGEYFRSLSVYTANNQEIKRVYRNPPIASLGFYYVQLTYMCNFNPIAGEEWKVMGMAPYGKLNTELFNDIKKWVYVTGIHLKTKRSLQFLIRKKIKENLYPGLTHYDIAYTGQFYYETLVIQLINSIYEKHPSENLIITGGCVLNSSCNGKMHTETPFKNVFIPSAPGDDGVAAGAALLNFKEHNPEKSIPLNQSNPYLGFDVDEEEILKMVRYSGYEARKMEYVDLYQYIAKEIQAGKIVGWVQGRAEFGPRALGNRSILANPSLKEMKDKLNATVKYREEFRPFAPAVLQERAAEYFENYHPTPYMERVLKIREDKRELLCAVNHIDNTGRLQTVTKESNEHFYNLISAFNDLTGLPVLLNTSFNVMGKPIVNSVSDMAAVFATGGLDVMVINQYVFTKFP